MNSQQMLQSAYLDIVFEGRNKAYGSYQLRQTYGQRMQRSGMFLLLCSMTMLAQALWAHRVQATIKLPNSLIERPIELAQVHIEEPPKPIVIEPASADNTNKMLKNTTPIVIDNHLVHEDDLMKDQDLLKESVSGKITIEDGRIGDESFDVLDQHHGQGQFVEGAAQKTNARIETLVEQMPQFPGGDDQLEHFLAEHLVYPTSAFNAGVEGNVLLKFVVNEDGSVAQVKVVRGFGFGSEEEALKVLGQMPHWIPGMNNGHPVKVWCHLPIHFRLK